MITKSDVNEELKNSLSIFEMSIPAYNLAILALLYQIDISTEMITAQYAYKITLVLTLAGILLLPYYSLRYWFQSRLKRYAFDTAAKYKGQLHDMAKRNDRSSKLGDYMNASDLWGSKFHVLDAKITGGLLSILVPVFFVNVFLFVVLTYLLKM